MPWVGRGYIDAHDKTANKAQTAKFRRWRPWLWGPLGRCWLYGYDRVTIDMLYGPSTYTWTGLRRKGWRRVEGGEGSE